MTELAFIGLGLMGMPMVRRLLAAGHRVTLWNRSRGKLAPFVEQGARAGGGAGEAARGAEITMTCLTDTEAVEEVVFGPGGIAEGMSAGKVLVDFSSIRP